MEFLGQVSLFNLCVEATSGLLRPDPADSDSFSVVTAVRAPPRLSALTLMHWAGLNDESAAQQG